MPTAQTEKHKCETFSSVQGSEIVSVKFENPAVKMCIAKNIDNVNYLLTSV